MVSFKNITIISDDIEFVDALGSLLEDAENYNIKVVNSTNLKTKDAFDNFPEIIIVDSFNALLNKNFLTESLSRMINLAPVIYLSQDDNDVNDTNFSNLPKPIYFPQLLKSIKKEMRDFVINKNREIEIGPYSFNYLMKRLVTKTGSEIRLTEMETKILNFLYKSNGKLIKRDTLLTEVWGYKSEVMTHTLETHIYRLRKKISFDCLSQTLLVSESGGYRLDL
ncbi:winged helix-turn-helix domain-containing protein [bacterium]|nr:winged helix-turn-helix domain-containing protein [bacterium]